MDKLKVAIAALALAVTATLSSQPSPAMMQTTAWTDAPMAFQYRAPTTDSSGLICDSATPEPWVRLSHTQNHSRQQSRSRIR
jgi:hypothetical protein